MDRRVGSLTVLLFSQPINAKMPSAYASDGTLNLSSIWGSWGFHSQHPSDIRSGMEQQYRAQAGTPDRRWARVFLNASIKPGQILLQIEYKDTPGAENWNVQKFGSGAEIAEWLETGGSNEPRSQADQRSAGEIA